MRDEVDGRIGARLNQLRRQQGWSLDDLAARSGVSRASLSRLEKGEVSATAAVLWRLCRTYGLSLSRLMVMAEADFTPLVPRCDQPLWQDPESGFRRRTVSPPADCLAAEVLECELPPDCCIDYGAPPRPGLEHHLYLLEGALTLTLEGESHRLGSGDCLRYRLFGASRFETGGALGARYILTLV
jgi:transcriptional regulator with XRE-family HTH domain